MSRMKKPTPEKVWASWHENVGFWLEIYATKKEARQSFDVNGGYDNWEMAKRDGWQIVKCRIVPVRRGQ